MQNEIEKNENEKLAEFYGRMTGAFERRGISPLASDRQREEEEAYEYGRLAFHHARLALDANRALTILETGEEITLADVGAMLGLSAADMAQAVAEPEPETPEQRLERMRAYREAARNRRAANEAKAAALAIGQVVRRDDGYWVVDGRDVRTTWTETGDGFASTDTPVVTASKCRANGERLKSRQYITVDAAEFGSGII